MDGHVFISYRRHGPDQAYVDRLAQFLTTAGIPVWFDKDITTGDRWDEVIRHHVDTCTAMIVVMTPAAEASRWVKLEITQAEQMRRPILPLLLDGNRFFRLADLQYDDVTGGRMPPSKFVTVLRELLSLPPVSPQPPPPEPMWFVDILTGHFASVKSVTWSPDGRSLASASHDGRVRVWDPTTGATVRTLTGLPAFSVAWSPDGHRLATGCVDATVRVSDPADGITLLILRGHTDAVFSVAWSPDGHRLATGSSDETLRVWALATGTTLLTLHGGYKGPVRSVAWSPDGLRLATAGVGDVRVWDSADGTRLGTLDGHAESVAWSPDGRFLATASGGGIARVWDPAKGTLLRTLNGHTGSAESVAWSPDGHRLATAGFDHTVRVWDPAAGTTLRILTGHTKAVASVAWSPDGRHLATGSDDNTARIWLVTPPEQRHQ